jgi:hypothetical protein
MKLSSIAPQEIYLEDTPEVQESTLLCHFYWLNFLRALVKILYFSRRKGHEILQKGKNYCWVSIVCTSHLRIDGWWMDIIVHLRSFVPFICYLYVYHI